MALVLVFSLMRIYSLPQVVPIMMSRTLRLSSTTVLIMGSLTELLHGGTRVAGRGDRRSCEPIDAATCRVEAAPPGAPYLAGSAEPGTLRATCAAQAPGPARAARRGPGGTEQRPRHKQPHHPPHQLIWCRDFETSARRSGFIVPPKESLRSQSTNQVRKQMCFWVVVASYARMERGMFTSKCLAGNHNEKKQATNTANVHMPTILQQIQFTSATVGRISLNQHEFEGSVLRMAAPFMVVNKVCTTRLSFRPFRCTMVLPLHQAT